MQWSIWRSGDYSSSHDITDLVGVRIDLAPRRAFIPRHQDQPPWTPLHSRDFRAMDEVTFTDDANEHSLIVDHGPGANVPINEKPRDLLDRRGWLNRDHWRSHNIASFHGL